ncbi:melanocyte-stimulating hormone receptor-like [Orbicella faveolata]|uniref:melanocyte-stimulating hormone receptor-like n=1 Tax=Orbicella faveolata TaxID=48498 RepID=UPI0009E218ED|nr:melanocyte-stimulating hormone receptor-like [Orbicella faveolata]
MDAGRMQALLCSGYLSRGYTFFFSTINVFLSIATVLGNAVILAALRKESSLNSPSKLLYSCLAVTDLLVGLIVGPAAAVHFTMWSIDIGQMVDLCAYSAAISILSFTILTLVSLITLTAISVDRLLALSLGLRYRHVVTMKRIQVLLVCVWILSISYTLMMPLWNYSIAKICGYTLQSVCLVVSAFCYAKIFLTLRHHKTKVQVRVHQGQPNGRGIPLNIKRYRKTLSAAVWVLITLVACYLPHIAVTALFSIYGLSPLLRTMWGLSGILVFLISSLNPLLYCWKMKQVRQAVKITIRQALCLSD